MCQIINIILIYLTLWYKVFLENFIFAQQIKKFPLWWNLEVPYRFHKARYCTLCATKIMRLKFS
jgi:hypothetical protein